MKHLGWHILAFSFIYLTLHFLQSHALGPEFVRFYAKDILLVPMLLFSVGIVSNSFSLQIELGNKEVCIAFLYCVLAFEIIIPTLSDFKSFDWLDIIAYALGAVVYLAFYKQSAEGIALQNLQNQKE